MNYFIGMVLILGCTIIYSFGGSMIILSAFFGIPTLRQFKVTGLIKKEAPNKYILPIIIWIIILTLYSLIS